MLGSVALCAVGVPHVSGQAILRRQPARQAECLPQCGFVSVVVAADPYRARAGPEDSKRGNSFGPEPRASKRHDLLHCEQAFDPRSRNAVGEGRSRPRGMRLIRTLTGCPASKDQVSQSTGRRAKDSIAYRHSLQKQPIHSPTHVRSLGTHIYTKTGCKLLILWYARVDSNHRPFAPEAARFS
jgi:hypothetical protein